MELFCLIYVPLQDLPLPVYPGLQVQRYEPIVLLHCAFTWKTEGEAVHSFTSAAKMNNALIKWNMKYEMFPWPTTYSDSNEKEVVVTEMNSNFQCLIS